MNNKREARRQASLEKQIDENLRRVYQREAEQDVPDRFLDLLQKLREQE